MQPTIAPSKPISSTSPTAQKERIVILDSLRGIAILGILLMNIGGMGLPFYSDPTVLDEKGINHTSWYLMTWFADGTQRALFSMLFGAGIILFVANQEKKVGGLQPADVFFRRQLWLLLFGLINIYILLWSGDILFDYACYGMLMFVFRNWSPKKLLIGAGVCMLLMIARENRNLYQDKKMIYRGERILAMDTSVNKLSLLQKDDLGAMTDFKERAPLEKKKQRAEKAITKMRNDYRWVYEYRTSRYLDNFITYFYFSVWDVLQFMFLGMAFYKNGVLLGKAKARVYLWMLLIGLGVGLTLSYLRTENFINQDYNWFNYSRNVGFEFYNLDRTFRTFGIFGGIMLLYKSGFLKWFFTWMRPAGQMAFTNYLMQSIIATIIFTGIGFGLFGRLERHQLYIVVLAIWIFQITFSIIWLRYFRFGPFEWAWRSLTYWKWQPMKKEASKQLIESSPIV
ncbi:MAG TPA: DUF418 domain-containing protein [Chitinophagaceae bacterium]|nr:DUF418 domain-containing protein [Chitinophagaceae bacterium]